MLEVLNSSIAKLNCAGDLREFVDDLQNVSARLQVESLTVLNDGKN